MIQLRSLLACMAVGLLAESAPAQFQGAGTADYALGNSSVMWIPCPSSLFLNPGELARIHQNEFFVTSGRFRSLESMSAAVFIPSTGTFGLGVTPSGASSLYSAGFGHLVKKFSTIGGTVSMLSNVERGFRFALGGAYHLPFSTEESGIHGGLSLTNLPTKMVVNVGAAYWMIPNSLRVQMATQTRIERAAFLGAEMKVMEDLRVQVGVRGFQKLLGGLSYSTSYVVLDLGAGSQGISFTANVRLGEAASDLHDEEFDQAYEAFTDQRFGEASRRFLAALQYDEYDSEARSMASRSQQVMDSSVTALTQQGQHSEEKKDFAGAIRAYAQILKMDPERSTASTSLVDVGAKVNMYVQQLLGLGDSLRNIKQVIRARQAYDLVLEIDPENDSASGRIDDLENLSKENVKTILSRARAYLNKGQLDEAQREYDRALGIEPKNSQARTGLVAVRKRRISQQLEGGKTAFNDGKYFEALSIFSDILEKDQQNKDAQSYLEKARESLKTETDRLFKTGLQFYVKEDYKAAIAEWDKVLMIQPRDSSTIEYRKRAQDKLKALEQFK